MNKTFSSRERMLAALNCQTPDHTPCSFMIFGALLKQSDSYLNFVQRQLDLGLDATIMLPLRQPIVRNDHYNLYGLPVSYDPEVRIEEQTIHVDSEELPVMVKTYHTPAGDLTTRVRQTEDWRWGDHVPFLDDYLIPRSIEFLVEDEEDLDAFQFLLAAPTEGEIKTFHKQAQPLKAFAEDHGLLVTGGWGVGMDMLGWVHGLNNLVYDIYDRPDFLRKLFTMIADWNRQRMAVVLEAGIDCFIKRAWYENTDFFTPSMWKEIIQPELIEDVRAAHEAGAKFGYIITANAMHLLDLIAESGVDAIIGIDPEAYDLDATKEKLGGRVCLWGGVNGHLTVEHGSPEVVRGEVSAALQSLGPDGFILSPVDNVRQDTPQAMANVKVLIETWQELTGQHI
ncbi:MAG: uroporphyrinogen decarboxylase family protein [Brevefilum sp.]